MRLTLILLLLTACAHSATPAAAPKTTVEMLKEKSDGWRKELAAAVDKATGWPSAKDCDGTKWAGEATAAGAPVQLVLAEYQPGEIHRRPKASGECYPKESASTVSADMLIGYMYGMYKTRDLDALERLQTYGEQHDWVMGDPAVFLAPTGQGLLGRAVAGLGGPRRNYADIPNVCLPVDVDYQYELQTLGILLDGEEAGGKLSAECFAVLKANAEKWPGDALIQGTYGTYTGSEDAALALLTGAYTCPSYVRGAPTYCLVHEILAAHVVLAAVKTEP